MIDLKKIKFDKLKPRIIKSKLSKPFEVQVARAGDIPYNDEILTLTEENFDSMVNHFNSQENPIPIYDGHSELLSDGRENKASGWVLGLKRVDEYLYAMCEFVDTMFEDIKTGAFEFTSIGMHQDQDGEKLGHLAMTNQARIDGLLPVNTYFELSKKLNTSKQFYLSNTIYKKETSMATKTKKLSELAEAKKSDEVIDEVTEGKTMEADNQTVLEELATEAGVSVDDMLAQLITCWKEKAAVVEDPALAETTTEVEDEVAAEDTLEDEEEAVTASKVKLSLLSSIKLMNTELAAKDKIIKDLQSKLKPRDIVSSDELIASAIEQGVIAESDRKYLSVIGKTDKKVLLGLLKERNFKHQVKFSKMINTVEVDPQTNTFAALQDSVKEKHTNEFDEVMLNWKASQKK